MYKVGTIGGEIMSNNTGYDKCELCGEMINMYNARLVFKDNNEKLHNFCMQHERTEELDLKIKELNKGSDDIKFIHKGIRVYRMNDYEWWASKWHIEDTNEWYIKEHGLDEEDNPTDEIYSCDLDKEGVWIETNEPNDIKELDDNDELGNVVLGNPEFGDLKRYGDGIFKYTSFREALLLDLDFKEPYCIASTEW